MILRDATEDDIEPITDMMMRFIGESQFHLTYDREQIKDVAWRCIISDEVILLVADVNGVLAGLVTGIIDNEFSIESCAYVNKFYVEKEFRGTTVATDLLKAFHKECKKIDVAIAFATSTAGMGELNEKLYVRLFERCGYETLGRVLIRDFRNE